MKNSNGVPPIKSYLGVPPVVSSREYKDNIQDLKAEDAMETLHGLNPVTFTYKDKAMDISRGVPPEPSSREYKDNINDLKKEDASQTLHGLNPVTFTYKECPQEQRVGFIAEDVPQLIATSDRKGLYAMDIVAVLTKVVQGQQETISALSAKVSELERMLKH
jgi:hypothetical protein